MVSKYARTRGTQAQIGWRPRLLMAGFYGLLLLIVGRLFHRQILQGSILKAEANQQYQTTLTTLGQRGRIFTSDQHLLVGNDWSHHLVGYPESIAQSPTDLSHQLTPIIIGDLTAYQQATQEAVRHQLESELELDLVNQLSRPAKWVSLLPSISNQTYQQLVELNLIGIGFEPQPIRFYPEASMAAHLTGFVGKDKDGQPVGYFGIEGALEKELAGRTHRTTLTTDPLGFSLFKSATTNNQGRDIVLTIRRDLQFLSESMLKLGLEKYGAQAGEIVIMEPATGHILALAASPSYDQLTYNQYAADVYKNPALISLFEPGSIMKTLTVAAGVDAGVVTADTTCPRCDGPRVIDKYTIKTWNEVYHPNITVKEALAKSDNIAMIFIAEELGSDQFQEYLHRFGIGDQLGIDLQGDGTTPFPNKWGPVELATRSFGQGISTTSLQMLRAVGSIANYGVMMQPQIVQQVIEADGSKINVEPQVVRRTISAKSAEEVTQMMVYAAQSGEAQWTASQTHTVAGKTGTSQIPAEEGGYKEDATIASFIGFGPASQPQYVMLVKLVEPQTSPWAAETAAPLWYLTAEKINLILNIPPDK